MNENDDAIDVIEAFADGEPVDPKSLTHALSDATGREHLVDLLMLREFIGGQGSARGATLSAPVPVGPSRAWLLSTAAALTLISALGGFVAGERSTRPSPSGVASADAAAATPIVAPKPTRVIRLEKGVDWIEGAGGH